MGAVVDSKTGSLLIQIAFSLHNKIIAVGNRRYKQRDAAATPCEGVTPPPHRVEYWKKRPAVLY